MPLNTPNTHPALRNMDTQEGTHSDYTDKLGTHVPENILPKHLGPQHCKPNIVRVVGATFTNGTWVATRNLEPVLQLIELKYSADLNSIPTHDAIFTKYTPLLQAPHYYTNPQTLAIPHKNRPPCSRTSMHFRPPDKSLHTPPHLPKGKPPDAFDHKKLLRILSQLHTNVTQWLHLCLTISRRTLAPNTARSSQAPSNSKHRKRPKKQAHQP